MPDVETLIHTLENLAKINRAVTLPIIKKKTGLDVTKQGNDLGEIQTVADVTVSTYFLNGGLEGVPGVRAEYPGSFSEEDDNAETRRNALVIYQFDPIDGTGDLKKTYQSENVMGSTSLVSLLRRDGTNEHFIPRAGIIFDNITETAIISDGEDIGLYKVDADGKIHEAKFEYTTHNVTPNNVRINRRYSYPQENFDVKFSDYLRSQGIEVTQVPVGGAGRIAMQFFRNYMQPTDKWGEDFAKLEPIDIIFNAQPDWKTWDVDPTEVLRTALGLPFSTTIYGYPISQNAAAPTLKDMHLTKGYVLPATFTQGDMLTDTAREFEAKTSLKLTEKNY